MRRILVAMLAAALLVVAAASAGGQETTPTSTTSTTPTADAAVHPAPPSCPSARAHKRLTRKALRYSHAGGDFRAWSKKRATRRAGEMRACAKRHFRVRYRAMRKAWNRRVAQYAWHANIDAITPYGKWAIPPYIVMCESHGSWSAYNPSGASGPYQLLGKGAPMPANTPARMARHHVIAYNLYAGGRGASHWVCA